MNTLMILLISIFNGDLIWPNLFITLFDVVTLE